mmetsp:Transcript_4037/g.7756  ORF Transcript_4037/g.7756 Transcript_4037/m.7756 type:complete len:211 (+) Transcript_4037:1465-2097(+)|eukprot:CAMPEP_0176483246 /NCGR_PEP_ID=MMETSP0200_2-20121128/3816_1 /TAXON_ID=947934 /ORGANISM="Chaetoceros sp., Strain GSL56" /LENGTH=210 /DNA_ID=CAMNT_0017879635 /DNA_START=1350 /DNA_END=1982 /DNA_ORIENTATION=-
MKLSAIFTTLALSLSASSTSLVTACGFYEDFDWSDLPTNVMEAAMELGYRNETWTNLRLNPIEFVSFDRLASANLTEIPVLGGTFTPETDDIIGALAELNLYDASLPDPGLCWDFKVNHYNGYSWEELADTVNPFGNNVQEAATILGWTQEMWDSLTFDTPIPASECKLWLELEPAESWAVRSMGWNVITWVFSPEDPRCKNMELVVDNN